jgi:hypothetical protein
VYNGISHEVAVDAKEIVKGVTQDVIRLLDCSQHDRAFEKKLPVLIKSGG